MQASRLPLQISLDAIYHHNLTLVTPILGVSDQSGSNWIVIHVFPLLSIALLAPKDVIKEAGLPKPARHSNSNRQGALQSTNPSRQKEFGSSPNEKMNMIR